MGKSTINGHFQWGSGAQKTPPAVSCFLIFHASLFWAAVAQNYKVVPPPVMFVG